MAEDKDFDNNDMYRTWEEVKPNNTINFFNDNGTEVGCLDFNTSELKFEGKADESAQIFIDWLRLKWKDLY